MGHFGETLVFMVSNFIFISWLKNELLTYKIFDIYSGFWIFSKMFATFFSVSRFLFKSYFLQCIVSKLLKILFSSNIVTSKKI